MVWVEVGYSLSFTPAFSRCARPERIDDDDDDDGRDDGHTDAESERGARAARARLAGDARPHELWASGTLLLGGG